MPATAFSALNSLLILSQTPVDSDIGIRYGMENEGLLTKSLSYKATRDTATHTNHRKYEVTHVKSNPKFVITVDADITLLAGALAAKHPGTPIHKAYVLDFYPEIAHGFSDAVGYFIYDDIDTGSPQGDLNTGKFSLTWFAPPTNTSQLVAAPSAPD
jgi:hypothetical protein